MKLLLCFGTRPEAIKMAPIIHQLQKQQMDFEVCITAQHREMLDQVLEFFDIHPDFDLDLMKPGQKLNGFSSGVLEKVDEVFKVSKPDLVLVQGDTTTAFIVALAAFNRQVKIGHVEAGLRTHNLEAPFPEEGNRQLISRIASIHFAPTQWACENLLQEGIQDRIIKLTGNTVVDAVQYGLRKLKLGYSNEDIVHICNRIDEKKKIILVTGHRRENFGPALQNICKALKEIAYRNLAQIIFPVHLNPNVKELVSQELNGVKNVILISPVNYPAMLWLLDKCDLVISDSGGIQEEAPSFNKPVLVTREVSERMEGVKAGFSFIVGSSQGIIVEKTISLLKSTSNFKELINPYGDGKAAERIVSTIKTSFE